MPGRGGSDATKWNGFSRRPTRPQVMTSMYLGGSKLALGGGKLTLSFTSGPLELQLCPFLPSVASPFGRAAGPAAARGTTVARLCSPAVSL